MQKFNEVHRRAKEKGVFLANRAKQACEARDIILTKEGRERLSTHLHANAKEHVRGTLRGDSKYTAKNSKLITSVVLSAIAGVVTQVQKAKVVAKVADEVADVAGDVSKIGNKIIRDAPKTKIIKTAAEARQKVEELSDYIPTEGRRPGHAQSSHGWKIDNPKLLDIRNEPDKINVGEIRMVMMWSFFTRTEM